MKLNLAVEPPQATIGLPTKGLGDLTMIELNFDRDDMVEETLELSIDKLQPVPKLSPPKKPPKMIHPTLQAVGQLCEKYVYDDGALTFEPLFVKTMLWHAFIRVQSCVEGVQVSIPEDHLKSEKKFPITLQARAARKFKKGELTLVPALGQIEPRTDELKVKGMENAAKRVHKSHLKLLSWKLFTVTRLKRQRGKEDETEKKKKKPPSEFIIGSQLFNDTKTDTALRKINPFWAMLQSQTPDASHNMVLENVLLRDLAIDLTDDDRKVRVGPVYQKLPFDFNHSMPVARNVKDVDIGDVLVVPYELPRDINVPLREE